MGKGCDAPISLIQAPFVPLLEAVRSLLLCEPLSLWRFSAGAGRTGTFIALSNILERVKAEGLLDVFQTVKSLRTQRPHMVQTVVGGKRDNVRSAARNLTAFSHGAPRGKVSVHKTRWLAVTPLLLFPPPGAVRLLLQGGSGFCRHLLRLCQFQITPTAYAGAFPDNWLMHIVVNVLFGFNVFLGVFCT